MSTGAKDDLDAGKDLGPSAISTAAVNGSVSDAAAGAVPEQEVELEELPVFEVIVPSSLAGVTEPLHHFKIFVTGRLEGFGGLGGSNKIRVVNRLPMMYEAGVLAPLSEFSAHLQAFLESVAVGIEHMRTGPVPPKDQQQ